MNYLWLLVGRALFWLSWPVQWAYLRIGKRTRVVVVAEGKILMLKGWIGFGEWGLPGGGVHRKEDPKMGAVREVYEETGVWLKPEQLHKLKTFTATPYGLRFRCVSFYVELPKMPVFRESNLEIAEVAWFTPEEIAKQACTADAREVLKAWLHR